MSTLWTDGNWTVATIDGPRRWLRPFPDDFSQYVFEQDYVQSEDDFIPTALDTPSPDYSDAYLVGEGVLNALGGGMVKWTRTYARIPASRQQYESYSWLVPGIGSGAIFPPQGITGNASGAGVTTLTASASPGISVGDNLSVYYTFTDSSTGISYGRFVIRQALTGTSGTTVVVDLISEPGGTISYQSLKKIEPGRAPEALEVGSQLQIDYFLPGVSPAITTALDIPIFSPLEIYDGDGVKTNSFTAATAPTITQWRALTGTPQCVVASVIRRWMGNIYERTTRYCLAQ